MTNTRLWHVTLSWRHRKQRYEQDIIICAPDKETASEMAKNRIPMHLLEQDDASDTVQIRTRDLGFPQNHKTYFASKMQTSAKDQDVIPLNLQMALTFAILWGHETGWRAGNPYVSITETEQMDTLYKYPEKERKIYDWAQEYLSENTKQPKEFFRTKLSELLNDTITEIEQLTSSIVLTDIDSAEQQAKNIINDAKKQARELLDQYQTRVNAELNTALELVKQLQTLQTTGTQSVITQQPEPEEKNQINNTTSETTVTVVQDTSKSEQEETEHTDEKHPESTAKPKIYDEDLPFENNEQTPTEQPASEKIIDEMLNNQDQNNNTDQDTTTAESTIPNQQEENLTQTTSSDTKDIQTYDKEQPKSEPDDDTTTKEPKPEKTQSKEKRQKTKIKLNELKPITEIITLKKLMQDDIYKQLRDILKAFTVTRQADNQTFIAENIYLSICKQHNLNPDEKTNTNIEIILDILNMTNRQKGLSGWDYATVLIRQKFPGCTFNITLPKDQNM